MRFTRNALRQQRSALQRVERVNGARLARLLAGGVLKRARRTNLAGCRSRSAFFRSTPSGRARLTRWSTYFICKPTQLATDAGTTIVGFGTGEPNGAVLAAQSKFATHTIDAVRPVRGILYFAIGRGPIGV